jgi:hypothetical protein
MILPQRKEQSMNRFLIGLATLAMALIFAESAAAQIYEGYLDVLTCKVKPERRADFDAVNKKMADANRRYKGDIFLTSQVEYGEQNTVIFTSGRENYAAIEKGMAAYEGALKEAFGPAASALDKQFNACLISSQSELRKRRGDLSINLPKDMPSVLKVVGSSRWVRTVAVHVRPGRIIDYEQQLKAVKEAIERGNPSGPMVLVSQGVAGERGGIFYLTSFRTALADFDKASPPLPQLLGDDGYQQYRKSTADNVQFSEVTLSRFLPELSNPPKDVADASLDFWNPKPAVMKKPAAKPSGTTKTGD